MSDVNDHDPTFSQPGYEFSVDENLPPGVIVGTVTATDADSGRNADVHYRLNVVSGEFSISSSGSIRTVARLDREAQQMYTLGVVASDKGTCGRSIGAWLTGGGRGVDGRWWCSVCGGRTHFYLLSLGTNTPGKSTHLFIQSLTFK